MGGLVGHSVNCQNWGSIEFHRIVNIGGDFQLVTVGGIEIDGHIIGEF